ncbi:HetZ-related protein 2 [Leptolyngbya sp. NK1-12]|uniref:HetZ-related protein 2 n=1 Tax=Leptolyngbya sp. NK1-12 TaxID=2547451 RepID=A0AA97AQG0_9CYAN|nr:HetZ-related protein 2 [Leptolyngbya sp. NK1-12]MBF2049036.1 HetZ-related protein 2 [Elainella sp. C42_A2020_010]WNZ23463.1 HetZ-related protein 2 [Leptolyngbya sp. NK1-12]
MSLAEELRQNWRAKLQASEITLSSADQESVISWLLGEDVERFEELPSAQLAVAQQAMDYRLRILQQRYLGVHPERAYNQLLQRLSSLFLIRSRIRTWVALSRDRRRTVMDVLQEVIQELIQSDKYIRQQISWIGRCTTNPRLRNALMLTSIEEYCLRPIRSQPLLVYRFVNYLRRSQRGGMTQVPTGELIRLVSEEITPDDADNPVSLLDAQAISQYQESQAWEEQQAMRSKVLQEFLTYLEQEVEPAAAEWLKLHLQGQSQEVIAQTLNLTVNQVYRLREKISYHAIRVFGFKHQSELVGTWLGTSLAEHNLGLTPEQWQTLWDSLTPVQREIIERLKAKCGLDTIAKELNLKVNQVTGEWSKIYLAAQKLRNIY